MIVYHGSTEIIKNPDVSHSKKYLDFGKGFYITTFENQAKKWAARKGMRQEKTAIVNVYELSEKWDGFRVLSFEKENEKWLDFVCGCRKGHNRVQFALCCHLGQITAEHSCWFLCYGCHGQLPGNFRLQAQPQENSTRPYIPASQRSLWTLPPEAVCNKFPL